MCAKASVLRSGSRPAWNRLDRWVRPSPNPSPQRCRIHTVTLSTVFAGNVAGRGGYATPRQRLRARRHFNSGKTRCQASFSSLLSLPLS
jgi:hypothetical protein